MILSHLIAHLSPSDFYMEIKILDKDASFLQTYTTYMTESRPSIAPNRKGPRSL